MSDITNPIAWSALPSQALPTEQGELTRRFVHTENCTLAFFTFAPGTVIAEHTHPNEQLATVLRGRIRFTLDGQSFEVGVGQTMRFPSGATHGAEALEASEVLDVFVPPRQDW